MRHHWDDVFGVETEMYAVVDDRLLEVGHDWIRRIKNGTIRKQGSKKVDARKRSEDGRKMGKGNSQREETSRKGKERRKVGMGKKKKGKGKC